MPFAESRYWCCVSEEGKTWSFGAELGDVPKLLKEGKQLWLDILRPSKEDIQWLKETFLFHDLALSDVMNNETRPKQETYEDILFTVFGAINMNPGDEALDIINLNLFLTRQYVVSVHLKPLKAVRQVKEAVEHRRELAVHGPDYIFYRLLDGVVDQYFDIFNELEDQLDQLEERIFSGNDPGIQEAIFGIKKQSATLRSSLGPKREALKILVYAEFNQLDKDIQTNLRDVLDHVMRMWDMLEAQRDLLNGLMDSYMVQISNRMNQIMKLLSVIATIMLPLSFITGIFGMNFDHIPLLHSPTGFWITAGGMAALAVGMLWVFKRKQIL
ncbi:MAG: magnesium/cobalt transporter CorA [Candidatus Hydrogenedentes bacterium]|nr:magnesium/cobalt transporter CorA [Candidatus Hydrogenedentota bacterium]